MDLNHRPTHHTSRNAIVQAQGKIVSMESEENKGTGHVENGGDLILIEKNGGDSNGKNGVSDRGKSHVAEQIHRINHASVEEKSHRLDQRETAKMVKTQCKTKNHVTQIDNKHAHFKAGVMNFPTTDGQTQGHQGQGSLCEFQSGGEITKCSKECPSSLSSSSPSRFIPNTSCSIVNAPSLPTAHSITKHSPITAAAALSSARRGPMSSAPMQADENYGLSEQLEKQKQEKKHPHALGQDTIPSVSNGTANGTTNRTRTTILSSSVSDIFKERYHESNPCLKSSSLASLSKINANEVYHNDSKQYFQNGRREENGKSNGLGGNNGIKMEKRDKRRSTHSMSVFDSTEDILDMGESGRNNPEGSDLSWKEFFGSSCDLAPQLLSIYDTYASSSKLDIAENDDTHPSSKPPFVTTSSRFVTAVSNITTSAKITNTTSSAHNVTVSSSASSSQVSDGKARFQNPPPTPHPKHSLRFLDTSLSVKQQHEKQQTQQQSGGLKTTIFVDSNENVDTSFKSADSNRFISTLPVTGARTPSMDTTTITSPTMQPQPQHPPHLPVPLHLDQSEAAKKRPLSVSSTSSSASSTSSLPRHQRKRLAAVVHPHSGHVGVAENTLLLETEEQQSQGQGRVNSAVNNPTAMSTSSISNNNGSQSNSQRNSEDMETSSPVIPSGQTPTSAGTENSEPSPFGSHSELLSPDRGGHSSTNSSNSNVSLKLLDFARLDSEDNSAKSASVSPNPSRFNLDLAGSGGGMSGSSYIEKVVTEIIDTERTYVRDLKDIIQGYLHHLIARPNLPITHEDMHRLFGNIEQVYRFNSDFLSRLEECDSDPVKVAECFVENNEGFVIYADYCTNYPKSVEVLTACMRDTTMADTMKHQQVALHHGLPLGSFLLKPVQRILKYHLLLQNILNNYDKAADGYEAVSAALGSMTRMAQHINEMKRKHEHAVRIQEIQSCLYGWDANDLTTYGDLVLEDTFRLSGAKAQRQIFLFEKCVLIAKRKEDGNLLSKAHIMNSNLMLVESIPREPLNFHIIPFNNPRLQYTIQARTLEQKRAWCHELKRLMLDNFSAVIPQKAKELVLRLGRSREEEAYEDWAPGSPVVVEPSKKSHTAPEYLEKKKRGGRRRSTSIIPDFALLRSQKNKKNRKHSVGETTSLTQSHPPSSSSGPPPPATSSVQAGGKLEEEEDRDEEEEEEEEVEEEEEEEEVLEGILASATSPTLLLSPPSRSRSLESIHEQLLASTRDLSSSDTSQRQSRLLESSTDDTEDNKTVGSDVVVSDVLKDNVGGSPGPCSIDLGFEPGESADSDITVMCSGNQKEAHTTNTNNSEETDSPYSNLLYSDGALRKIDFSYLDGESCTDSINGDDSPRFPVKRETNSHRPRHLPTQACTGETVMDTAQILLPAAQILQQHEYLKADKTGQYDNWKVGLYDNLYMGQSKYDKRRSRHSIVRSHSSSGCSVYSVNSMSNTGIYNDSKSSKTSKSAGASPMHKATGSSAVNMRPVPLKCTGAYRNSVSASSHKVAVESMDSDDPWVPRTLEHMQEEVRMKADLQYQQQERQRSRSHITRSSSFTSMEDVNKTLRRRRNKTHARLPSDSTVIFSNRNAYTRSASFTTGGSGSVSATASPHTVRRDRDAARIIARLGTPVRDEHGPPDLLQEIARYREHERIVTRYGTPPRTQESGYNYNDAHQDIIKDIDADVKLRPGRSSTFPGNSTRPSTVHTQHSPEIDDRRLWADLEEYIMTTPPETPTPSSPTAGITRPGSFHGITQYSVHQHIQTPPLQHSTPVPSPSTFLASSESIVDSLKNAVLSFTARFTGRGMRSTDSSPVRTPRARSAGALEDMKIHPTSPGHNPNPLPRPPRPPPPVSSPKIKDKTRKEKRHHFVHQLARAYSDRIKRKTYDRNQRDDDEDEEEEMEEEGYQGPSPGCNGSMELSELLREQGGQAMGERIATARPTVLGTTYTLQRRHRKQRNSEKVKNDKQDDTTQEEDMKDTTTNIPDDTPEVSSPSGVVSLVPSVVVSPDEASDPSSQEDAADESQGACGGLDLIRDLPSDQSDKNILDPETKARFRRSFHQLLGIPMLPENTKLNSDPTTDAYFYERQFVLDLEASLGDASDDNNALQDGSLFAENPTDSEELKALKVNIHQTVKLIEQRNNKPFRKTTEIKRAEKALCFQDILKSLETSTQGLEEDPATNGSGARPTKTMRDRTRELSECAMLTRIRQNSFTAENSGSGSGSPLAAAPVPDPEENEAQNQEEEEEENLPRKGL